MSLCKCGCGKEARKSFLRGHNTKRGVGGGLKTRIGAYVSISEAGCWNWTGMIDKGGYGEIRLKNGKRGGKRAAAHRVSYELFKGPIPPGKLLRHKCDNRRCVNPDHLVPGTNAENLNDMVVKGRSLSGEKSPAAILTESDAKQIKASAEPLGVLAQRYGVKVSTISKIRTGKNWKHLPGGKS